MMYARLTDDPQPFTADYTVLSDIVTGAGKGRKVCLVSDTTAKAPPTAEQVAFKLIEDGWDVTLLDLTNFDGGRHMPNRLVAPKAEPLAEKGKKNKAQKKKDPWPFEYVRLKNTFSETNWYTPMRSLCAYQWLKTKDKDFDLIIFHQGFGAGHFSCLARSMGLAFAKTPLVVFGDDPYIHWLEDTQWLPQNIRTEVELDYFERETVRRADGVFFTNKRVPEWMVAAEWELPAHIAIFDETAKNGKGKGKKLRQGLGEWLSTRIAKGKRPILPTPDIFISVCMATYNRPDLLRSAIKSMEVQTYKHFELVVVDDGSTDPGVDALREELAPLFAKRKWQWVKQKNAGPAAGRMHATRLAKGDYFVFIDDDNIALEDELEMFARASSCGADIITCIYGLEPSSDPPPPFARFPSRPAHNRKDLPVSWVPYGVCLAANIFCNTLGDTNALFKRSTFEKLGGFLGDRTMLMEDWEFFTRAAIAGCRIEVMPEIVMLYLRHRGSRHMYGDTILESHIDTLKPYNKILPKSLQPLLVGLRSGMNNYRLKPPEHYRSPTGYQHYQPREVHPAFQPHVEDGRMQIALCTDDNYAIPGCVTLMSLFATNKHPMDIHVISSMSPPKVAHMRAVAAHFGRKINIIDLKDMDGPLQRVGQKRSRSMYSRLYLPKYLPKVKKVLYLDCDLLIRKDIKELWDFDLHDNLLAAVSDQHVAVGESFLKLYGGDYFNSGVMLINLDAWRREDIPTKVFEQIGVYQKAKDPKQWWDQSPLNRVVNGRWASLSVKWNLTEGTYRQIPNFYKVTPSEFNEIAHDPHIFHFIMQEKPWIDPHRTRTSFAYEYNAYEKIVKSLYNSEGAK